MTTEATHIVTPDSASTQVVETPEVKEPKELREALDRSKEDNKTLRLELMEVRLDAIGLTPESGLGKAIAKEYDGVMTVEAVGAFALEEYGHEGGVETTPPDVETGTKLDQLNSVSEAVTPPPPSDPLADAEAAMSDPEAGRVEALNDLNAKSQAFYQEHYGPEQT